MEHRSATRMPTALHTVVFCPQFGLFRGDVKNASLSGLFVRTRNVSICVNAPVTLTLQDPDDPEGLCEVSGVVVHQNSNGFGVRLQDMNATCRSFLETAISAAGPLGMPRRMAG